MLIGTTDSSLGSKLVVDTDISVIRSSSDPTLNFVLGSASSPTKLYRFLIDDDDSDKFQLRDLNSARITVDGSGNVGIGTTVVDGNKLAVLSDGDGVGIYRDFTGSGGAGVVLNFGRKNSGGSLTKAASIIGVGSDNTGTAGEIRFTTAASGTLTERMRIDSSGKVGIGTTSPTSTLFVNGTSASNVITARTADSNGNCIIDILSAGTTGNSRILFSDTAGNDGIISYSHNDRALVFGTAGTSEDMRIDSSGNVGIATTSGGGKLAILSNSSSYEGLELQTPSGDATGEFHIGVHQSGSSAGRTIVFKRGGADGMDTESMRINSHGNVGIGTSSPEGELDLGSSSAGRKLTFNSYSNLFSEHSSGAFWLASNFYGNAGAAGFKTGFTGNFGAAAISVNATGGSSNSGIIEFFTDDSASKNFGDAFTPTERMRVNENGHLFHGCTSGPSSSDPGTAFKADPNQGRLEIATNTTSQAVLIELKNPNGTVGDIRTSGSGIIINGTSDYRVKENAVAISDGITRLKTLKPYRFNFKADPTTTLDGFFAHEVTAVPEAVTGTKDEIATKDDDFRGFKKGDPILQGIDQSKLVPLLVAAVQEAIAKIETLETEVAALKAA